MARLSKWCPLCARKCTVRLELQPLEGGRYRWVAWCSTCNTPMESDGPELKPDEVAAWFERHRQEFAARELRSE